MKSCKNCNNISCYPDLYECENCKKEDCECRNCNEFCNWKPDYKTLESENAELKQELEAHKKALVGLALKVREEEKLTIPAEKIVEIFLTVFGKVLAND